MRWNPLDCAIKREYQSNSMAIELFEIGMQFSEYKYQTKWAWVWKKRHLILHYVSDGKQRL